MKRTTLYLLAAGLLLSPAASAATVPSPAEHLGFELGSDRKLADWRQIVGYFRALDAASDRVVVEDVGPTTEGRPFLVVTLSSESNMTRLDAIRRSNLRLADPRGLSRDDAEAAVAQGKVVVALHHGIHSTEVAGTQTALETAHLLATSKDPRLLEILDNTVVVMIPSQNPDGTQNVTEWYRKWVGTRSEGGEPPFLYHKYAGHDNNRDWYMFTQAETRLTVRHVFDRWRPQIVHDLHQMRARGARMFLPPYLDPWEPNVDPALVAATNALGSHVAGRLTAEGKAGVVVHALYDAWAPARAYPFTHGGVRILSECASARLASPLDVKWEELSGNDGYDPRRATWNFPLPWPGGVWRVRNVVDYQVSASLAILDHAAKNREFWLRNSLDVNRRACARQTPYAFVFPAVQRDPLATARLLEVLRFGSVELHRAKAPFEAEGQTHDPGSHVVLMAQPYGAFAKTLLERQQYPDVRLNPSQPRRKPYDVTAHTLPLLMGVAVVTVTRLFTADLEAVSEVRGSPGRIEGHGRWLALGHKTGELAALGRLLEAKVGVRWALASFTDRGRDFPAGTLLVPSSARDVLEPLAEKLSLTARTVDARPPSLRLKTPRVALYQSWVPSMDEGWTRFVFERQIGIPYETLHDAEIRSRAVLSRFDVVLLADQSSRQILAGATSDSMPVQYLGGIAREGVRNLKAFVEAGGTLVALNAACQLPVEEFGLAAENVLAEPSRKDAVQAPGSILRVEWDPHHPLAHGLESTGPVWFQDSPAFAVRGGAVVARYAEANPLLSGWLLGGEHLMGKAALAEVPLGKGRVVLFGFRPQYRAQSWATYVPLLNALYLSAAEGP